MKKIINIFPQLTNVEKNNEQKKNYNYEFFIIIFGWILLIVNILIIFFFFKDECLFLFLYLFTKPNYIYDISDIEKKINDILNTNLICKVIVNEYRIETTDGKVLLSNGQEIKFKSLETCQSILNGNFDS